MSANANWLLLVVLAGAVALADPDEELPEAEFIEYLGFWDGSDEDWMIFNDPVDARPETRGGPAPEGEEPAENDDED